MDIEILKEAFKASWIAETALGTWSSDCPELNQCAVTAMVIQDYLGGDLLRCECDNGDSHYWNRLPNGKQVDLTYGQFRYSGITPFKNDFIVRERSYVNGHSNTVRRYKILKQNVANYLQQEV